MLLSILICTIEERQEDFEKLRNHLIKQINENNYSEEIEILDCCDNKTYPVGVKRNFLLENASGKFICFIDDDDWVSKDYIKEIMNIIKNNSDIDCIGIKGKLISLYSPQMNKEFIHSIRYATYMEDNNYYYRCCNHLCPIRRDIASKYKFPLLNRGEDTDWAISLAKSGELKNEVFLDKIIYYYRFDFNKSATSNQ